MKNVLYTLFFSLLLISCQSDDDDLPVNNTILNSTIKIDGVAFVPTEINVVNGTPSSPEEESLVFTLKNTSQNEQIIVKIDYPNSATTPNGIYNFGIGQIGTMLFAQGSYVKGSSYHSLSGYTVQVTLLGNDKYKIDFQNVEAVNINTSSIKIIIGYCEGDF